MGKIQRAEVEQAVRQAGCVIVDPRIVRRVIKQHRDVAGIVPHGRCYTIGRDALATFVTDEELGVVIKQLPERVVLVARPSPRDVTGRDRGEAMTRIWRTVFHARVHEELDAKVARGELDEAHIRKRIEAIGQTEFDEIRAILRHDDLVLPPGDEREVYIEFAALYLELRHFAPTLLVTTFPGLAEHDSVMATLLEDVDVVQLLTRDKPADVAPPASTRQLKGTSMPSYSAPATLGVSERVRAAPVSAGEHAKLLARAAKARKKGNDVRAALLAMRAATIDNSDQQKAAEAAAREALHRLGERLNAALAVPENATETPQNKRVKRLPEWTSLTMILADRASSEWLIGYGVEARLLFELQRAAEAFEKTEGIVDVASWILTLGKRQIVRTLPATRELRVARRLRRAAGKVRHVRIGAADRKLLAKLLAFASSFAEENVRVALKPRIDWAFDEVKLFAQSGPERLARDKIVEELLDRILDGGYLTFDGLRDALSRNMLKLEDLSGPQELWRGDKLLAADKELTTSLDGIYRRGDVYLRWLQKLSSVPFGTITGRAVALYFVLPISVAYVALEGFGHMVNPALGWFSVAPIHALTWTSFGITALVVFALIHSAPFRAFARQLLDVVALLLATLLLRGPRALAQLPAMRRWFARPGVRVFLRRVLVPVALAAFTYWLWSHRGGYEPFVAAGVAFALGSAVMGSSLGAWAEDFVFDQVAPTWHVLSRQWLPGMLRLIMRVFTAMMELLLRGMYGVDEWLRFREGQSGIMKLVKGAAGIVWAVIAYLIRIYVTLFVEPFVNPLKHFPTVTVADKLLLQWFPGWIVALSGWLSPLGSVAAGTIATVTVFLFPSVFGFLAWELKENYRLYQATRPETMPPAPVGPDGETMRSLLVVGLHSGTLPKLYERLRRAAQREDDAVFRPKSKQDDGRGSGLGKFRAGISRVEESVQRFVARELVALLHRCPRWTFGEIEIEGVDLSSNRVRIALSCRELDKKLTVITIEEQSGHVVAGVVAPGFLGELARRSDLGALLFENALAGFYQRAEVDLVREQLESELGTTANYDLTDDGLVVWPGRDYRTELVYRIGGPSNVLVPELRGEPLEGPPRILDPRRMFYREQAISWLAWVTAWSAAEHPTADVPRLLRGVSLFPSDAAVPPVPSSGAAPA